MWFRQPKGNLELGKVGKFGISRLLVGERERLTHTYIIGITGMGKSKFLEHMLYQDVISGRGCGVLDPHSDLVDDLFRYLLSNPQQAEEHWQRIVYFDPSREDYLIPFNVLNSGFTPYKTAQNVIEAFRRTWPQTLAEAPRFANIASASVMTLTANNLTLVEMPRLLTDSTFREQLLQKVTDPELINFWNGRFDKWGREAPLMIESILNKVTAFTMNPQLRLILGANENRLNFRKIMDDGKVFIADLGRCDAETRRLIGSLIVTSLEQAARSRKELESYRRKPFFFCIDEFQDFCSNDGAAQTLAQILSECRKFGLHLTLAHQTLAQINERMKGALGNIQLKVVFGVSRQDAEILAKHLFMVNGENIKHQIQDSQQGARSHPIYYSLWEEWEKSIHALQRLEPRTAYASRPGSLGARLLKTITVKDTNCSSDELTRIKSEMSRQIGIAKTVLAQAIESRIYVWSRFPNNVPMREPLHNSQFTNH